MSITLDIPKTLKKQMFMLTEAKGNRLINKALEAAARPALAHMRNEVRILRTVSDASSGATYNSLISKATYPSKGKDSYGYFYAGVDKQYTEEHMRNTTLATATLKARKKSGGSYRDKYIGFTNKSRRRRKADRKGPLKQFVKSYQKTSLRTRKGRKSQTNIPRNYWHLLEDGFAHRSGARFKGYGFRRKAAAATAQKSISKFEEIFVRGFLRENSK